MNQITDEYTSKVGQNLGVIMLKTMVIVKMGNCTYDEWKKAFDADTDAQFMENINFKISMGSNFLSAISKYLFKSNFLFLGYIFGIAK